MNKNQVWKLFFVLLILLISFGLISHFEDRELGEYALSQVTSDANASNHLGYETFEEVIDTLRQQIPEGQKIDFGTLRDFGTSNNLDYSAQLHPVLHPH